MHVWWLRVLELVELKSIGVLLCCLLLDINQFLKHGASCHFLTLSYLSCKRAKWFLYLLCLITKIWVFKNHSVEISLFPFMSVRIQSLVSHYMQSVRQCLRGISIPNSDSIIFFITLGVTQPHLTYFALNSLRHLGLCVPRTALLARFDRTILTCV